MARAGFTFHLSAVLAFAAFWIGAVQNAGAGPFATLIALAVIGLAGLAHGRDVAVWRPAHTLSVTDLVAFGAFAAVLLAFTWPRLAQDLWSDGVYNASLATRHAQLFVFHLHDHAPALWARVADVDVRLIVWAFNAAGLTVVAALFIGAPMVLAKRPIALTVLWAAAFLIVRFLTSPSGGVFAHDATPVLHGMTPELDPHPTLRLAPLWAMSALLGPNDHAFRLAGFVALVGLMALVFARLRQMQGLWTSLLAVAALATTPVLWHTAYLVEASIWTALAGIAVFAAFVREDGPGLVAPALVVALAAWMRAPAFILLVPLLGLIAATLAERRVARDELVATGVLVLLALAGAANAILGGSPAVADAPPLEQVKDALVTQTPWIALVATTGLAPFFFTGHALRADSTRAAVLAASLVAFLLLAVAVFYGPTRTILWGLSRYQAEFGAPLVAAGVLAFAYAIKPPAFAWRGRPLTHPSLALLPAAALAVVLGANIFSIATIDANRRVTFPHALPGQTVKSEAEYAIAAAFDLAAPAGYAHTYYVGIWYGGFQGVLQGLSGAEHVAFARLNERHRSGWAVNANALLADPDIRVVLVEADADFGVLGPLRAAGWRERTVTMPRSGLSMLVLARP